jgi:hypothetical protein
MTSSDGGDMGQRSNAAFSAVIFANYYMYSLDNNWLYAGTIDYVLSHCIDADGRAVVTEVGLLKRTPYQYLTAVADFWLCYLQKNVTEGGNYTYNSINDCTYELCAETAENYDINPTTTLSFLRYLFSTLAVIEESRQTHLHSGKLADVFLKKESMKRAAAYQDVLDHLAPVATGTAMFDGKNVTVFQGSYLIDPLTRTNPVDTYNVWPAGTIGLGSDPQTLQIARDTVMRGDNWDQSDAFPQVRTSFIPTLVLELLSDPT